MNGARSQVYPGNGLGDLLREALRVLPVEGYRSAIGGVWNAVVDDLANRIRRRNVDFFKTVINPTRKVTDYEGCQAPNNDQLSDGAYEIDVIDWEASKILKHAKEVCHVFFGHPKSDDPTTIKVLAMLEDCVGYMLSELYPSQMIDIDDYLTQTAAESHDCTRVGISFIRRSNIEFATPISFESLSKDTKQPVIRRVDHVISKSNTVETEFVFDFATHVAGQRFLSAEAPENTCVSPWSGG